MEGKHNEFIKKTEDFTRSLLTSMEFKVRDPVCPSNHLNLSPDTVRDPIVYAVLSLLPRRYCGNIRLEEMSQHLVSCKHLLYSEDQRNMILNTEYENSWYKPNFKASHPSLVYKLKESQHFFILQLKSVDTSFIFYIIQHNEDNISEHQYIARLEVYGETKNIIRIKTVRVCPSGIHLEDARNKFYTLGISHQELENMCARQIVDDVSEKYHMYVKFKVMII